jgi:hypothetical protein
MLRLDRDALICDFAETYHVYDLKALPVQTVALLACGLREDSRIKQKINGTHVPVNTLLLAHIVDRLGILIWQRTKDGQHGRNKPESIAEQLLNTGKRNLNKVDAFETPEEFEEARRRILERR